MLRILLPLLLGAATGAVALLLAVDRSTTPPLSEVSPPANSVDSTFESQSPLVARVDPASGEAAALIALVNESPAAALSDLAALSPGARRAALESVARALVRRDAPAALRLVEQLRGDLRAEIRNALLMQWSLDDPTAVVAWLASLDPRQAANVVFDWDRHWITLAAAAPRAVFESAAAVEGDWGSRLRAFALGAWAEHDAVGAAEVVLRTRDSAERDRYAFPVGFALGSHNPSAALEWLRSMEKPDWSVVQNTLRGIGQTDLALAVDLLLTEPMAQNIPDRLSLTIRPEDVPVDEASDLAERLVGDAHPKARDVLQRLVQAWAVADVDSAIHWILANEESLSRTDQPPRTNAVTGAPLRAELSSSARLLALVADSYGERDLDGALRIAATLPNERRAAWVQGAFNSSDMNVEKALRVLESYRNEPFYESTYTSLMIRSITMGMPQRSAALLDTAPPSAREFLIPLLTQRWAEVDPTGARNWALTMPAGAERDRVLGSLVGNLARSSVFDARLLAGIESPAARQSSTVETFVALGRINRASALRIFDEHYTDSALRTRIEAAIDRPRGGPEPARRDITTLR